MVGTELLAMVCRGQPASWSALSDTCWCSDQHVLELQYRRGARFDCRITCEREEPYRLYDAIGSFRYSARDASKHFPGGSLSVDNVIFSHTSFRVRVRGVHFSDLDVMIDQEPCESGSVRAGGFHPTRLNISMGVSPGQQVGIATGCCREFVVCDSLPSAGKNYRMVSVFVRINADDHFWLTRDRAGGHDGGVSVTSMCGTTEPGRTDTTVTRHFCLRALRSHIPAWSGLSLAGAVVLRRRRVVHRTSLRVSQFRGASLSFRRRPRRSRRARPQHRSTGRQ